SFFCPNDVFQPDADHNELASETYALVYIERPLEDCEGESNLDSVLECPDWNYDLTVSFVAEAGQFYIGKTLGIKVTALAPGAYTFIDNLRVEWSWASTAYDPDPADEAEDVPIDVNLAWSPGLWAVGDANGHEVYFGTSYTEVYDANTSTAGIYRGTGVGVVSGPDGNDRYSYDALETLELGKPYYWRIDEVNEGWGGGPVPPVNNRWKGDVWSFRTTGLAYNVYPSDLAEDIPALNLLLRWEAGTSAAGHDVYFGSDEAAVENATTSTPVIYRSPTQALSDVNYAVEDLDTGENYYWRIDEVNTVTVKGDVWSFTTGIFLIVDSFEFYADSTAVKAVWKDQWSGIIPKNHAETFLEFADANKFLGPGDQSMRFYYRNFEMSGGQPVGCTAIADTANLEIGPDWTVGGVKSLMVNFCGDTGNGQEPDAKYDMANDRPWISLEDGGSNEGIKRYPTLSHLTDGDWHAWNVSLLDPNFSSVDMNNVVKVYIGFGGVKGGAVSKYGAGYTLGGDTVWFDDIRLYPPRCLPAATGLDNIHALGDFTGPDNTEDCNTNYFDLEMMAEDWMKIDGDVATENRPAILSDFVGEPNWTTGYIGGALEVNNTDGQDRIDVTDPRLPGLTNMTITGWVKRYGDQDGYCALVASREAPGGATELMCDGGKDNQASYGWNGDYWNVKTGLVIPDQTWTFIAVAVEPTQATVYMHPDPCAPVNGTMSKYVNVDDHGTLEHFWTQFRIGRSNPDGKRFEGLIDDIRIYDWTLDEPNLQRLVDQTGEPNAYPIYWYKFDETEGLEAADSGYGTQIYQVNILPTNVVPKDPCDSEDPNLGSGVFDPNNMDIINFLDYRMMAEHWLEKHQWP
ncbi:MAG: LamG domain-containing protein, partial [Planctomycetota bacterium]